LVADLKAGRSPVGELENGEEDPDVALSEAEKALARAELRLSVVASTA
jgi:hypothetical protein